ncbi:MAG: GNAT family N-acetyltransferase [Bacteroidales bacterium]
MKTSDLRIRYRIKPGDVDHIEEIVESTGFFREDEIIVACELPEERLTKGLESGYEFVFIEHNGKPIAYSCFGLIPCTLVSYDLYWIVTHNDYRGNGVGSMLINETEKQIKALGGKTIYVETSSKPQYLPTRMFYEKNQYLLKTTFEDFYDVGDNKLVYIKKV